MAPWELFFYYNFETHRMVLSKRKSLSALKALQKVFVLFILTITCRATSGWAVENKTEGRPNILFLFADEVYIYNFFDIGYDYYVPAAVDGQRIIIDEIELRD